MTLVLCGLGSFFTVQFLKILLLPSRLPSVAKMVLVVGVSIGISAGLGTHNTADLVVYGIAGAGLAVIAHRLARLISVAGDGAIMENIRKQRRP